MSDMFFRSVKVIIGNRIWDNDPLDIDFNVKFDTDQIPDESEITIYNLSRDSINYIKVGMNITVNAGYDIDRGTILNGVVAKIETTRDGVDKKTTIKALNVTTQYLNKKINKVYKGGVSAEFIIRDLLESVGIRPNLLKLQDKIIYQRGYNANGKLKDVINTIVRQCKSRLIIRNSAIIITTKDTWIDEGFLLNKDTGLISIEKLDKADGISTHKIEMLLNHSVNPYTLLRVESSVLNGLVLVVQGEHNSNFTTSVEVRVL
ncbi:phage protein [Clostridium rectalis]|uniref:phage protein n=1 Tax=Clostridium rectalis TaxID=2040295 RepID=UPI000F63131B|nr:hypothetical protein [Clostridium rectalis]